MPSAVGSLAVVAAASGAVTMPQAAGAPSAVVLVSAQAGVPERPRVESTAGALDTVAAAGQSLAAESTEAAKVANAVLIEVERKEAAERAARAEREGKRWVSPLSSYRISAGFGAIGRLWSSRHTGVDLSTAYGRSVKAISGGEIIYASYDGPYGNKIIIRHWDGTESWYCHLSRFVQYSGHVMPGDEIGKVGSTGNSTGPHLHLEIHPDGGDAVNPLTWLADRGLDL